MIDKNEAKSNPLVKKKIRILHVMPYFFPATNWGGPVFSVKAICDQIAGRSDFDLRVLTTDALGPGQIQNLNLDSRTQMFPAGYEVHYARRDFRNSISMELLSHLPRQIRWADLVHVTETYSSPIMPTFLLAKIMGKPLIWSPRGALQATAQWDKVRNRRIKGVVERIYRVVRPSNTVLHVTSEVERDLSLLRIPGIDVSIIPNSVDIPPDAGMRKAWKRDGKVRLMFISRIHQKKGIESLIDAMAELPKHFELNIYGTGEPDYVNAVRARITAIGARDRIFMHGHVGGGEKEEAFRNADIFVLPTHSENFGNVIAEAMAHGLPVITTKNAPWRGIDARRAGFWIENTVPDLISAIVRLSEMDLEAAGARGRAWMIEEFSPEAMGDSFANLYRDLVKAY